MTGFEPVTSSLPRKRSTPELHRLKIFRAGDRVRTGDIQLGRLTLYQLSYSRIFWNKFQISIFQKTFYPVFLGTLFVGRAGFEPAKVKTNRFTVCPRWPLEYLPALFSITYEPIEGLEPTTPRLQISCSSQLSYIGIFTAFLNIKKSAISNGLQM